MTVMTVTDYIQQLLLPEQRVLFINRIPLVVKGTIIIISLVCGLVGVAFAIALIVTLSGQNGSHHSHCSASRGQ